METDVRFRLTSLEERSRDILALSLAIKATLAALPGISNADRNRAVASLEDFVKDLPDAAAMRLKAGRQLEDILSTVPGPSRI